MTPLHPGDIVLVIGRSYPFQAPPGCVGTVLFPCPMCRALGTEAYNVEFSDHRIWCYDRPELRKLEPPADGETDSVEREREEVT
jgi:hypothetical protein